MLSHNECWRVLATRVEEKIASYFIHCYRFLWSPYRFLHSYGVKGPRPLPIFGNFLSIHKVKTLICIVKLNITMSWMQIGHDQFIEEQMKNFGQVFG